MPLFIGYRLTHLGWAECTVTDDLTSCTVTASYLSDALRHLILAGTAVLSGFRSVTFLFEEEPGAYRWIIRTPRVNEIELRIAEFDSAYSDEPDEGGQTLFRTTCLPLTFAQAIERAASEVLGTLGERGYDEQWAEHSFPTGQLIELRRLLAEEDRAA